MTHNSTVERLISIKQQVSDLGIEFLDTQKPLELKDLGTVLKPFIDLTDTFDKSIKKLISNDIIDTIPKSNTLKK